MNRGKVPPPLPSDVKGEKGKGKGKGKGKSDSWQERSRPDWSIWGGSGFTSNASFGRPGYLSGSSRWRESWGSPHPPQERRQNWGQQRWVPTATAPRAPPVDYRSGAPPMPPSRSREPSWNVGPGPPLPEDEPVRTSAGAGVGAPTPAPNPSKASMNKVPVVAQEFVDNWSDSTWLTDERTQALRARGSKEIRSRVFRSCCREQLGF